MAFPVVNVILETVQRGWLPDRWKNCFTFHYLISFLNIVGWMHVIILSLPHIRI